MISTSKKRGGIQRQCLTCGMETWIFPSEIQYGRGKFCSRACHAITRITCEPRTCITCGTQFKVRQGYIHRGGGKFCSRACMGKGESGQLSPRYKHGQTGTLEYGRMSAAIRQTRKTAAGGRFTVVDIERIAIRQGFRCVYCKCSIKRKYHIDHIRPVSLGGSSDPSNLQLLCPPCNLRKYNLAPEKFAQKIGFLF